MNNGEHLNWMPYEEETSIGTWSGLLIEAIIKGKSGFILLNFRAFDVYRDMGTYFEGIFYHTENKHAIKHIEIFSKRPLIEESGEPLKYLDDEYYVYRIPADIEKFRAYKGYEESFSDNTQVDGRTLMEELQEYYTNIFRISPSNDL